MNIRDSPLVLSLQQEREKWLETGLTKADVSTDEMEALGEGKLLIGPHVYEGSFGNRGEYVIFTYGSLKYRLAIMSTRKIDASRV